MRLKDKRDAFFWHTVSRQYRFMDDTVKSWGGALPIGSIMTHDATINLYPDWDNLSWSEQRRVRARLRATLGMAWKAEGMGRFRDEHLSTEPVFRFHDFESRAMFLTRLARRMRKSPKGRWKQVPSFIEAK